MFRLAWVLSVCGELEPCEKPRGFDIVGACERFNCPKTLVIAYFENSLSSTENFDLAVMFREEGFTPQHRLAWVDQNPVPLVSPAGPFSSTGITGWVHPTPP